MLGVYIMQDNGDLYDSAVQVVLSEKRVSISLIQRKLKIGYNRASLLVQQMEQNKIISSPDDTGFRTVIVDNGDYISSEKIKKENSKRHSNKSKTSLLDKIVYSLFFIIFIPVIITMLIDNLKESSRKEKEREKQIENIMLCEEMIKSSLKRPATYKTGIFSKDIETINMKTRITIKFEAKNGLGLPIEQIGVCVFDEKGLADFNIYD